MHHHQPQQLDVDICVFFQRGGKGKLGIQGSFGVLPGGWGIRSNCVVHDRRWFSISSIFFCSCLRTSVPPPAHQFLPECHGVSDLTRPQYKAQMVKSTTRSRLYSVLVTSGDWLKDTWLNCALLLAALSRRSVACKGVPWFWSLSVACSAVVGW